jgi:hypothetical protein
MWLNILSNINVILAVNELNELCLACQYLISGTNILWVRGSELARGFVLIEVRCFRVTRDVSGLTTNTLKYPATVIGL